MTAAERQRKSQQMRALWASGHFANRPKGRHPRAWTKPEETWLREHAGSRPLAELTAAFNRQFGLDRTPEALHIRMTRLGISQWARGLSLTTVERGMGLDHRAIVRWWLEPGLLPARRWSGRGPNAGWWIEEADLKAFLERCQWAYDWRKIREPRWRRWAEVANRADPWLPYRQAAKYLGFSGPTVNLDDWRKRGLVPCKRRPGASSQGDLMVRARDLPTMREAIDQARAVAQARGRNRAALRARYGPRDERGWLLGGPWTGNLETTA